MFTCKRFWLLFSASEPVRLKGYLQSNLSFSNYKLRSGQESLSSKTNKKL